MATSFVLVSANPANQATARKTIEFVRWALHHGQPMAMALNYLPLPPAVVEQVEAYWVERSPLQ